MIKNIIFDIGNVLLAFQPVAFLKEQYDDKTAVLLSNIIFNSDDWQKIDQGIYSETYARDHLVKKHPIYEKEIIYVFENWKKLLKPISYSLTLMKEFKDKGYHIYILSNIGEGSFCYVKEHFNFIDLVEGVVCSYQCKINKPDVGIFEYLFDTHYLLPGECLFFDDSLENVTMGRKLGMQCIHFQTEAQVKEELSALMKENMIC